MSEPRLRAIHHVQVAMPPGEEQKARDFYQGVLGLVEVPKPANLAVRGGVWFKTSGIELHVGTEDNFRPSRKAHVAFLVDDLARLTEAILSAGVRIVEDLPLEGFNRIYVYDPFGNRIELMQPV